MLAVSASSIVVETHFGNVTIDIGPATVIDAPPEKGVGIDVIEIGSRVAVSMNRPLAVGTPGTPGGPSGRPDTPPGLGGRVPPGQTDTPPTIPPSETDTPPTIPPTVPPTETDTPPTIPPTVPPAQTDTPPTPPAPSFRTATASRIVVIPSKATRTHNRKVVESVTPGQGQGKGRLKLLGEDGEITELELPDGVDGVDEGSDVILIVRGKGGKPATTDTPIELRGLQNTAKIAERLERLQAKFEDNPEKAAKFATLQQKRQERAEARLQRTADKAPPEARGAAKALNKARGNCPEDLDTDAECPKGRGQSSCHEALGRIARHGWCKPYPSHAFPKAQPWSTMATPPHQRRHNPLPPRETPVEP